VLTGVEINLIAEALRMAASRHLSCARFKPQTAKPHDDKAARMLELRDRLLKIKRERHLT
jgi:hypothetical protein